MRMERLIGIMCVLADAQRTTIGALAERFEVSTRTIARDLDTLGRACPSSRSRAQAAAWASSRASRCAATC